LTAAAPAILIVDDDPHVREALTDFLTDEGFRVRDAANGAEALERLQSDSELPALMIVDLAMPVMDGYAFLNWKAEQVAFAELPVVILSANIEADDLPGNATYLRKPIDGPALMRTIRHVLEEPIKH